MSIKIAVEYSPNVYSDYSQDEDNLKIGRDASCQIVFTPAAWSTVSRKHAEIINQNGTFAIVDSGSRSGTYVNGEKVLSHHILKDGAVIQLGIKGPHLRIIKIESRNNLPAKHIDPDKSEPQNKRRTPDNQNYINPELDKPQRQKALLLNTVLEETSDNGKLFNKFKLVKNKTIIGRNPEADIYLNVPAPKISRLHAEINWVNESLILSDLNSFNGTFLNGGRLNGQRQLYYGDYIQLGSGPVLYVVSSSQTDVQRSDEAAAAAHLPDQSMQGRLAAILQQQTIAVKQGYNPDAQSLANSPKQKPILNCSFGQKKELTIGRAPECDIRLEGLQISNIHAQILLNGNQISILDKGSTNGSYLNGQRIKDKQPINKDDLIQIGPYLIQAEVRRGIDIFDTRSRTRIDVVGISKVVPNNSGGGILRLLDNISLTIQPNEFVGLLGPSGAGKSTFMDALNGMRPASDGRVLVNSLDLYENLDSIKQSIGYVPQDDIIHRELTVYRTLYYVAKLRLSKDVAEQEIDRIISEVMDVTGLSERRDVPISQLSGGQRKRVSIAVELITKPSVIFLDEPTSGLDPATEEKIMVLFRQIAESGRTVILTTHAMENVKLFDKIVLLMRGKLVFYGTPQEALAHVKATSFKELYDKLEEPIERKIAKIKSLPFQADSEQKKNLKKQKEFIVEEVAEQWKNQFLETPQYTQNVKQPAGERKRERNVQEGGSFSSKKGTGGLRQMLTLAKRYAEVLKRDKFTLLVLFGQAPIIAFLTYLVVDAKGPRDFPFFMLALVAVWFGTSVSAREIIRERAVYNRERMVNLGLVSYIGSKLIVLAAIVGLQCFFLFGVLKLFDLIGLMKIPGVDYGLPQLGVMILTGLVGISIGLFISATVKTSEMATSLVPLILIPQILFSGLVGVPEGKSKIAGVIMPATWAFDEMKRLSANDVQVLKGQDEKAEPAQENEGRGLYKEIEHKNDLTMETKEKEMEDYRTKAEKQSKDFEKQMEDFQKDMGKYQQRIINKEPVKPESPVMDPIPPKAVVEKIPEDLSNYVDFLHPWGQKLLDPTILFLMFVSFIGGTVYSLRRQDVS